MRSGRFLTTGTAFPRVPTEIHPVESIVVACTQHLKLESTGYSAWAYGSC